MPITCLDPQTALIVVDLQQGLMGAPFVHPIGEVVENVRQLTTAFRRRGLPVALVNVAGGAPGRTERPPRIPAFPEGGTDLIPELDPHPSDLLVTKRTWGALASTDLEARLKALAVTQVVVVGVATATGVESTARQAYELGFNVTLAVDAMTDARRDAHDYSVANVFPRLGEVGLTQDILDRLELRSA
jgi:nicotinamidase-related amidase